MSLKNRTPRQIALIVISIAYAVMWLGGIGHYVLIGRPPLDAPWAASLFLFLAGLIVILSVGGRERLWLAAAALTGFAAEVLGVRYGFIFSEYSYTEVLIPQLFRVPVVMLSAWMVLVSYSRQLLLRFDLNPLVEALLAAGWMTAIDLVIDPLAANQLGYWRWVNPGEYYGIPFHNFVGWFGVSLIIFLVLRDRPAPDAASLLVGLSIVLFFTSIALSLGLFIPAGVGILLVILHLVSNPVRLKGFLPLSRNLQLRER
ncbi:MAG: carotenoid biosynthesis protein [Blastocatellales bacterium]